MALEKSLITRIWTLGGRKRGKRQLDTRGPLIRPT